jgi:hypothetical protein
MFERAFNASTVTIGLSITTLGAKAFREAQAARKILNTANLCRKLGSKNRVKLNVVERMRRSKQSTRSSGANNPAFGKVYARGGRSVKGYYDGHFFRSLLEYSFMKHLEGLGYALGSDVEYESFTVPYAFEGKPGTYRVDFHVKPEKVVYEVKPSYVLKRPPARQIAKWEAARAFFAELGLAFKIVTDEDFQKRRFEDVYGVDEKVVWDERTFKYFKASKNHHFGRDGTGR